MAKIYVGPPSGGSGGGGSVNPTSTKVPVNYLGTFIDSLITCTPSSGNGTSVLVDDTNEQVKLMSGTTFILVDGAADLVRIDGTNGINLNGGVFINNHLGNALLRFLSNGANDPALKANATILEVRNGNDNQYMGFKARDISATGNLSVVSNLIFDAKSIIRSAVDGILTFTNNAVTSFTRLNFGGDTAAFPSLKRNGAEINVRTADDSTDANLTAKDLTASGAVYSAGLFVATAKSILESITNGNFTLYNQAKTAFSLLQFGGVSNLFPALKRNATALNVRLADDSADAPLTAAAITSSGNITASTGLYSSTVNVIVGVSSTTPIIRGSTSGVQIAASAGAPNASAQLEVVSTTRGFLPPRMTALQRAAIATPAVGLMVYQTDVGITEGIWTYKSTGWVQGV